MRASAAATAKVRGSPTLPLPVLPVVFSPILTETRCGMKSSQIHAKESIQGLPIKRVPYYNLQVIGSIAGTTH